MKTCEVCNDAVAKYRCPGCAMETCCLKCVNQHKADKDCDGQRDKTSYVKLSQFTDLDLLSDYRLLEDGGRKNNNYSRDNLKRRHNVPNFLKDLEKQANKRKVKLRLMPYPMSRRKNNSTIYQHRLKKILWQIEWIFPQADYTATDRRVNEDDTLGSILDRHIGKDTDPLIKHRLKCYTRVDAGDLGVFLKQDSMKSSKTSYYRLDISKSITENLENKHIVEHPIVYVVLRTNWSEYPIAPLEVAVDEPTTKGNINVMTPNHETNVSTESGTVVNSVSNSVESNLSMSDVIEPATIVT